MSSRMRIMLATVCLVVGAVIGAMNFMADDSSRITAALAGGIILVSTLVIVLDMKHTSQ